MFGTKLTFSGKEKSRFCAQAKFGSGWSGMKVIFVAFSSGSVVQSSFPLYFS